MKVAVVEFAGRGGLIHYAFQLCRALARRGADVTLVTERHYELEVLPHDFRVVKLLRLWDPKPRTTGGRMARLWQKARRPVRALAWYREWARLAWWLRRGRFDVVQLGDLRFATDLAGLRLLRAAGLRLVDVCHNVHPFAANGGFRRTRVERALYRRAYRQFAHVFVHYDANRARFLRTFDLPPARVTTIPHGDEGIFAELRDPAVDAPALRARLGLHAGEPVVLFFGTLARYKGIDLLIEAFARVVREVPAAQLVIAGFPVAGFDVGAHRALAGRLGIADAVYLAPGYVPAGEVAGWMDLASVAVFPYRDVYQSGALAAATTFGVPVVATRVGAMPEVIADGESGLLVPPEDVPALAGAVARLLRDPALAARLGARAAAEARGRAGWDAVAATVLREYERMVHAPPRAAATPAPSRRAVAGEGA